MVPPRITPPYPEPGHPTPTPTSDQVLPGIIGLKPASRQNSMARTTYVGAALTAEKSSLRVLARSSDFFSLFQEMIVPQQSGEKP